LGCFLAIIGVACAAFVIHEIFRWVPPYSSWFGGPGFVRVRKKVLQFGRHRPEKLDAEKEGFEPKWYKDPLTKLWFLALRKKKLKPKQPPLPVKICFWVLQAFVLCVMLALWAVIAWDISSKSATNTNDSYLSNCIINNVGQ